MTEKKYIFYIKGMHCNACVLMTESAISDLPHVTSARTDLKDGRLEVEGDFGDKTPYEVAEFLTKVLEPHGYTVYLEKQTDKKNWSDFKIAIPLALGFAVLFLLLQKVGLVNLINSGEVTYGTAFLIGIIASLSTCMAVVGGLLLSMSATYAKESTSFKSQIMFHMGRIISFFVLGGVIGTLGSAFTLNIEMTFILNLVIGLVMFILGINLLNVFDFAKKIQFGMPRFISKHTQNISKINHSLTPLLVGVATFFLPCGFTQSMQLYTLSTGTFLKGGITMLAFALGTLPVLSLVSFGSFNIKKSSKSGIFFKTAGLIVIMFAIFNIINSLVVVGFISPIFNF